MRALGQLITSSQRWNVNTVSPDDFSEMVSAVDFIRTCRSTPVVIREPISISDPIWAIPQEDGSIKRSRAYTKAVSTSALIKYVGYSENDDPYAAANLEVDILGTVSDLTDAAATKLTVRAAKYLPIHKVAFSTRRIDEQREKLREAFANTLIQIIAQHLWALPLAMGETFKYKDLVLSRRLASVRRQHH